MTLEEAIKHCEEKACYNSKCALEHRQLAEWLKELKEIKSKDYKNSAYVNGLTLIGEERMRQITEEGWSIEHDDKHDDCELANAAASYAMDPEVRAGLSVMCYRTMYFNDNQAPPTWPWEANWWKPTPNDRIKELVKAGALIAAEIDRLLRLKEKQTANEETSTSMDEGMEPQR